VFSTVVVTVTESSAVADADVFVEVVSENENVVYPMPCPKGKRAVAGPSIHGALFTCKLHHQLSEYRYTPNGGK
jgi:hypothetical protein